MVPLPTPGPSPLESGGGGPMEMMGTMGGPMNSISLGLLIQYINQRTYSDLLNLAEILPRKSDMEKKMDIVQFAQRTRHLYVRLLALVKWAASASKVDKCNHIMNLLEKQNGLFTNTADELFRMTRENLVNARLPHFHIPAAVETLTTGSYDRLPLTIKERILPLEPIKSSERTTTLTRLEQIVQHRLVTTELPNQMRTSRIENGRVRFTVEHEFEVSLTLMGDTPAEPWRLLEIEILVEDKETGDGKSLVHSMQIGFIHQLIQSRLVDNPDPLQEVYTVLHSFSQALQLEVLYAQTLKLLEDRLDYHIRIEEYLQGQSLAITYWRQLTSREPNSQMGYRLTVQVDPTQPSKPLMVFHTPTLGSKEAEIAERAIRSDHLSIERLLVHTIYLRTKARLYELKQEMDRKLGPDAEKCQLSGSPALLHVPILQPNLRSEQLLISVDTHSGVLLPHVPQYDNCPIMNDIQTALNHDKTKLDDHISELRYWLMLRRTEKTLQHLPATAHERLPLMYYASHPLNSLGKHKVFITFHRHPGYVVIVEFKEKEGCPCEMDQSLYLMVVKQASIEDNPDDDTVQTSLPKSYMRAYELVKLDSFVCTHGPSTKVDIVEPGERALGGKRKLAARGEPASKRVKVPAYFLPEVSQCVAMADMKLPLSHLAVKLRERGVYNTGEQVEEAGKGLLLRLVDLPTTEGLAQQTVNTLRKHLLSASIRIQVQADSKNFRVTRSFMMEYLFTSCPVTSQHPRELSCRRPAYFTYEVPSAENINSTVDAIIADWLVVAKLYELVLTLAEHMSSTGIGTIESTGVSNNSPKCLSEMVRVRSFNYKSIVLSYGPNFDAFVNVCYSTEKESFILTFGMTGEGVWASNSHTIMVDQLENLLNENGQMGLVDLATTLHHTYQPLLALAKLSPHLGVMDRRLHPVKNFTILPQSPNRVCLVFRNVYCLNIDMLSNGLVSMRDGAFSNFENKLIEQFYFIINLKAFLSKYVDETAINRRRSQSEDDNPPTPIPLDDSPWPTPKAASPARHGPMTPPTTSNPHTPASPHPGGMSQTSSHNSYGTSPSGGAGFSLASPPSLPPMNPSPAMLPHASPSSGFLAGNSPSASHSVASPSGFLAPSPGGPHSVPMHSPASTFMQGQGSLHSARMLPNRPYTATVPTILTHDAFHTLCSPSQVDVERTDVVQQCILQQFLGLSYIRKYCTQTAVKLFEQIKPPGGHEFQFKTATFQCQIGGINPPAYMLAFKVQPLPELHGDWNAEELQIVEKFFTVKVAAPPYRQFAVQSFLTILKFPQRVLKDCIRIMQLELMPTLQQQQQMKWSVQWCLTQPPIHIGPQIAPPGLQVVVASHTKYLFYLQLTRINIQLAPDTEPPTLVLPVVYDINTNKTQMAERRDPGTNQQVINEIMARVQMGNEMSLFPCIRELLQNLSLGADGTVVATTPLTPGQPGPTSTSGPVSQSLGSPHLGSPLMGGTSHAPGSTGAPTSVGGSMVTTIAGAGSTITTCTQSGPMPGSGPFPGPGQPHMTPSMGPGPAMQGMQSMQSRIGGMGNIQPGHMQQMPGSGMMQGSMQPGMHGPGQMPGGTMQGMPGMQSGGMTSMSGGPGGMQGGPGGMQAGMQGGPGSMQGGPGGMQGGPGGMQGGPGGMRGPGGMQGGPGGMQGGMQQGQGGMQGFGGGMMNQFSR